MNTERERFEYWYTTHAFNYSRDPLGSRDCSLQWAAWQAAQESQSATIADLQQQLTEANRVNENANRVIEQSCEANAGLREQLAEANRQNKELAANLQYYYRNDLCKAPDSNSKDCLCWHDLPVPDGIKSKLRIKLAQSKRDGAAEGKALSQGREGV
jgi:hypothetical protein